MENLNERQNKGEAKNIVYSMQYLANAVKIMHSNWQKRDGTEIHCIKII